MATTYAPDSIQDARRLLLAHLPGLTSAEVGIVGDTAHQATGSSYHLGRPNLRSDSYSIVESSRDRNGLSNAASGLDIGDWAATVAGKRHTLRSFSVWLVAQCKAGTADTRDIREVIYSPDGESVKRWDRLGKRSTGDSSHLWHTHISYFRDSEHRDKTALFRRYLTEIGLLEDDVALTADDKAWLADKIDDAATAAAQRVWASRFNIAFGNDANGNPVPQYLAPMSSVLAHVPAEHGATGIALTAIAKAVSDLAGRDFVDEQQVVAGVLVGLDPAAIAAAIPTDLAQRVSEELAARLAS